MNLTDANIFPIKPAFERYPLPSGIFAILRMQYQTAILLEMVQGRCQNSAHQRLSGMGCQLYHKNGGSALISTDEISPVAVRNCLRKGIMCCSHDQAQRTISAATLFSSAPVSAKRFLPVMNGFEQVCVGQAKALLLNFHNELISSSKDMASATTFRVIEDEWRILRSDGSDVHFTMPRSLFRHEISKWFKGKNYTLPVVHVGHDFSPIIDQDQKELISRRVKNRIILLDELIKSPPIQHGSYPVIIDAHLTGGLVHEAFGHAAETDSIFKGSILGENGQFKKGARVGPDYISITEGPIDYDWGYQPFSANGFPRETIAIVKNGILNQALADVFTAGSVGVEQTGAERVEKFSSIPIPRMSNIRLEVANSFSWECDFEDVSAGQLYDFLISNSLINPDETHLFLSGYRGGQVNSASGDFVFSPNFIYRFKHGRTELCQPAVFSGNIFAVLDSIKMGIGRQHIRRSGMCGKNGQKVPTSGGGPLFTLINPHPEIRIGGK